MKQELIKIVKEKTDWQHGVKMGVELLEDQEIATSYLAKKIIDITNLHGPYYVIMPKVALAHAEPSASNLKMGLALIKFDQPVHFSNDSKHDVQLLFVLSAIDGNSHMDMLVKFANLFGEHKALVDQIIACDSVSEISLKLKGL